MQMMRAVEAIGRMVCVGGGDWFSMTMRVGEGKGEVQVGIGDRTLFVRSSRFTGT